jgi:hypothetical protein
MNSRRWKSDSLCPNKAVCEGGATANSIQMRLFFKKDAARVVVRSAAAGPHQKFRQHNHAAWNNLPVSLCRYIEIAES